MDKYDELKGRLAEFLLRDEVHEDAETISAYNLFVAMVTKFNDLVYAYQYQYAPKTIKEKANKALKVKHELSKRFKKKSDDVSQYSDVFTSCDLKKGQMNISFYNGYGISRIAKDIGEVNLYYDCGEKVDDCVIDACIDDVYIVFKVLEEFYQLFREAGVLDTLENSYSGISQKFSFEGFSYELTYNKNGLISPNLTFSKDVDPNGVQNRNWYGERLPITDLIEEHGDELLKRFPIKFSELDEVSQAIVRDYLKSKENQKQKTM